jgi:hypothetical protein
MNTIAILSALAAGIAITSPAMARGDGWAGGPPPPKTSSTSSTTGGVPHAVPEPGMLGLLGAGAIGLAVARRRRKRG